MLLLELLPTLELLTPTSSTLEDDTLEEEPPLLISEELEKRS
jgi:hypothetical protein